MFSGRSFANLQAVQCSVSSSHVGFKRIVYCFRILLEFIMLLTLSKTCLQNLCKSKASNLRRLLNDLLAWKIRDKHAQNLQTGLKCLLNRPFSLPKMVLFLHYASSRYLKKKSIFSGRTWALGYGSNRFKHFSGLFFFFSFLLQLHNYFFLLIPLYSHQHLLILYFSVAWPTVLIQRQKSLVLFNQATKRCIFSSWSVGLSLQYVTGVLSQDFWKFPTLNKYLNATSLALSSVNSSFLERQLKSMSNT